MITTYYFTPSFASCWTNFFRSIISTWWGSHPLCLLSIYLSIIRSKLDYGCFFFGSAYFSNWKKINKLQISCLRTIMGYVFSTPCPAIEVESICSPFNIRCRWFAGKFILKSLSLSYHLIFDIYYSLYLNWRYAPNPLQSYLLSLMIFRVSTNSPSTQLNFLFMSFLMTLYYVPLMFNWVISFLTFPPMTSN